MITLGIDTATDIFNLAIIENGKMIVDYRMQKAGMTHSAVIIPALKNLIDFTGLELNKLTGIAVSVGPGSFTGLRIGLATAKGLAFSLSIPIIGVNTLESYALDRKDLPGILCPMMKARKGEYYFTLYRKENHYNDLIRIEDYQCKSWLSIKEKLLKLDQPVYILGYGLMEAIGNLKSNHSLSHIHFLIKEQDPPGAVNIALMGEKRILSKQTDDIFELSPFYICKSAAEIKNETRIN